jgi:hypothetical protein
MSDSGQPVYVRKWRELTGRFYQCSIRWYAANLILLQATKSLFSHPGNSTVSALRGNKKSHWFVLAGC